MDVSLGSLRRRLLEFRAWDSSGTTFNDRVRESLNFALDRLAGDVPEALIPDEEHIVLYKDIDSADTAVSARVSRVASYTRVLSFMDTAGTPVGASSLTAWRPTVDGTWDGIMHMEITDGDGVVHRRQCREWWNDGNAYYVTLDRPWRDDSSGDTSMAFRIYQPEFFVSDDVMEVLEPARIYDSTKQQVWAIDTAGAYRQDMVDFQGDSLGRPYRFWRGRHFQVPAPHEPPQVEFSSRVLGKGAASSWAGPVAEGEFQFCYTYVWGRRDEEWQDAPSGIRDPQWESAPSPVSESVDHAKIASSYSIKIRPTNIDAMLGYGDSTKTDYSRSGLRIRIYVARLSVNEGSKAATFDQVESSGKFYLLTEIEPTAELYTWDGSVTPDYHRSLKHSTGYYAHKVYPHQDARYELDLRVLRLPRKFTSDQDTAPIQRDSVPALLELSLYYLCLQDGVDQQGAELHLNRYSELVKRYRMRYANPGRIVEPVPLYGHTSRKRFGVFNNS